jgi:cytochrome c556
MFAKKQLAIPAAFLILFSFNASAGDNPQVERQKVMEDVRESAKVIGGMMRGKTDYDVAAATEALTVFKKASAHFGDLFPEGSESGEETEAAPAIWEDRGGFDAAISEWADAIDAALAALPGTLDEAKPVLGSVMRNCKSCHDNYRVDKD